jgi:P27 family predicted phage terminase small subunit
MSSDVIRYTGSTDDDDGPPEPLKPPDWVVGRALDMWNEIAPQLVEMRVLTELDRMALGRYCMAFAEWRHAEDLMAEHGKFYAVFNPDGSLKIVRKSPQVEMAFRASREMSQLEAEFGLTPSARAALKVEPIIDYTRGAGRFMTGGGAYMTGRWGGA